MFYMRVVADANDYTSRYDAYLGARVCEDVRHIFLRLQSNTRSALEDRLADIAADAQAANEALTVAHDEGAKLRADVSAAKDRGTALAQELKAVQAVLDVAQV